jgi:hypothetical protein
MTIKRFNRIFWLGIVGYIAIRLYMMINELMLTYGG